MTDIAVPLVSRRRERVLLFQKVQHALPAFALLWHGVQRFTEDSAGYTWFLAGAEVLTSALVIGSLTRKVRIHAARPASAGHHHHEHAHGVDWIDVFLAAMLATEVFAHWHETGHVQRPTVLLAAVTLIVGLIHGRMSAMQTRRRALRVTPDGMTVGGRFFTRFSATWREIAAIHIDAAKARVVTHDGRERKFDLADLQNPEAVRHALDAALAYTAQAQIADGARA